MARGEQESNHDERDSTQSQQRNACGGHHETCRDRTGPGKTRSPWSNLCSGLLFALGYHRAETFGAQSTTSEPARFFSATGSRVYSQHARTHTLMPSPVIATAQYVLCSPHGIKLAAFPGSLRKNVCTLVLSSIGQAQCPTIPKNQTQCVSRGCDSSSRVGWGGGERGSFNHDIRMDGGKPVLA